MTISVDWHQDMINLCDLNIQIGRSRHLSATQENLAAVANAASLCFFGFFSRKSSITQKVSVRLI